MCSLKFSLVTVLLLVLQNQTSGQLQLSSSDSQEGGLFGSRSGGELNDGDVPSSNAAESNGYLPPVGSAPSEDVPAFAKPPAKSDGSGQDDQATGNQPQFVPPANLQVGCAAALLCVEEQLCTMTGMISQTPLQLTAAQKLRQVPMVDCRNPDTGIVGKCCRDPNYVDPWPAGGLLPVNYTGGFDEQGFPSYLNLSKKKPTQPSKNRPPQAPRPQQPLNLVPLPQQPSGSFLRPQQPSRPPAPQQPFPQTFDSSEASLVQPTFDSQRIVPGQPQPTLQPAPSSSGGSIQLGQGQQPGQPGAIQRPRPFQLPQYPQQPKQPFGQQSTIQPQQPARPGYPSSTPQPSNYDVDIEQPGQVQPGQPINPGYPSSTAQPPSFDIIQTSGQPSSGYPSSTPQPSGYPSSTLQPSGYPTSTPESSNYDVDIEQPGQVIVQPQQPIRPAYPSSTPQPPRYEVDYQQPGQPQQPIQQGYPSSTPQPPKYNVNYQPGQPQQPGQQGYPSSTPQPPKYNVNYQPGQPIVIGQRPQPGKTYEVATYPEVPNQIPNQPYEDSQEFQVPAEVPVVPQGTSPRPGIYPGPSSPTYYPKFPGQGSLPNTALQVAIASHTPGARCGIVNQVQYPGNLRESEAAFGEIPWEAMILLNSERRLLCSGAIVAPNLVLTAANCVYGINPADISIKAGEYKLGFELKHEEPYPFEIVQVASIVAHPNYQPGSPGYDTALLYLEHPIKLDQHIDVICVNTEAPVVTPGRKCISVGWGKEILKLHAAGAVQNKIEVDVLRESECAQRLANAETHLDLHDSLVCGKPHKQSSNMCMVDLGGPLACEREDGTYEIVGVYSQDTGCLPTNQVATFALIDSNWINDAINGRAPQPQLQPQQSQQPQQYYQPQRELQLPYQPQEQPGLFDVLTPNQDQQQPIKSNGINYPGSVPAGLNQYLPPS